MRMLFVWLLLGCLACQDYSFVFRPRQRIVTSTVREVVVANTDTDILFVVDNSGSMKEEQENLQRNTAAFITELARSENAYRVGVITTDVFGADDAGRLRMVRARQTALDNAVVTWECKRADPNGTGFVDDDEKCPGKRPGSCVNLVCKCGSNNECPQGSTCNTTTGSCAPGCGIGPTGGSTQWIDRPTADPLTEPRLFLSQSCRVIEDFKATIASLEPIDNDGSGCFEFDKDKIGDGREAGLKAVALATTDTNALNHNGAFLRPDADLALIFLTDESDCSFADYPAESLSNPWCYDQIDWAVPVIDYLEQLSNLKPEGGERKVRAALIGGGIVQGADAPEFVPRGCRLDRANQVATGDCGCWSSTTNDFACEFLNSYGHTCTDTAGCNQPDPPPACENVFPACASSAGGACDTPRCEAMPAARYHEFIQALGNARVDVGFPRGTFEDSICQPEYDETLRLIANTVVLSDCFNLEDEVLSAEHVQMVVRTTNSNGEITERNVPRLGGGDADCQTCSDSACQAGAWTLSSPTRICLDCGLKKEPGKDFVLSILNELLGFDGGGGDP